MLTAQFHTRTQLFLFVSPESDAYRLKVNGSILKKLPHQGSVEWHYEVHKHVLKINLLNDAIKRTGKPSNKL